LFSLLIKSEIEKFAREYITIKGKQT